MRTVKPFLALLLALGCVLGLLAGCDVIPERPTSGDPGRLIGAVSPSGRVSDASSTPTGGESSVSGDHTGPTGTVSPSAPAGTAPSETAVSAQPTTSETDRIGSAGPVSDVSSEITGNTTSDRLSDEKLLQIAYEYARLFVPVEQYEFENQHDFFYESTTFVWRVKKAGIPTPEKVDVVLTFDGKVVTFNASDTGRFVDLDLTLDEQALRKKLDDMIRARFGNMVYEEDPKYREWGSLNELFRTHFSLTGSRADPEFQKWGEAEDSKDRLGLYGRVNLWPEGSDKTGEATRIFPFVIPFDVTLPTESRPAGAP